MYSEKVKSFLKHVKGEDIVIIDTMSVEYPITDNITLIRFDKNNNDQLFKALGNVKNCIVIFDRIEFWIDDWNISGNFQMKFRKFFANLRDLSSKNNLVIMT